MKIHFVHGFRIGFAALVIVCARDWLGTFPDWDCSIIFAHVVANEAVAFTTTD